MKKYLSFLLCFLSASLLVSNALATTEVAKQAAIEKGLIWLAATQQPDGRWAYGDIYSDAATTGAALLAFLEKGYKEGTNVVIGGTDYGDVVGDGLKYIFSMAITYPITPQPAGDPDSDGNGLGVKFVPWGDDNRDTYVTGLVLPAIAMAGTPAKLVTNGNLTGWTYEQVIRNTVDYFAYGQNDADWPRGGWRYYANSYYSDNSTAQWPILGMFFSSLVGANPPAFVETELDYWITNIQNADGGSDYDGGWGSNMARTGALLLEMAFSKWHNEPAANLNQFGSNKGAVDAALNYLNTNWTSLASGWDGHFGNAYGMWGIYKGLEATIGRNSTGIITNLNPPALTDPGDVWNWYEDYCEYIVSTQKLDGSWDGYWYWTGPLATAWYISILQATQVPTVIPVVEAANKGIINMYCYPWDGTQYTPISGDPADPSSNTSLVPWTGFFLSVNQDVDLLIPKSAVATKASAVLPSFGVTLDPGRWYLFTVPAVPDNGDIFANFGDDFDGSYESTWRISKWIHDTALYQHYTAPGSLPDLLPGRGFWAYHINDGIRQMDLDGLPVDPTGEYYELKLAGGVGYHMAGNPFLYDILWKDCKIRVYMTDGLPLAKIASGKIESWQVGLKLQSTDGKSLDTYNRAGVVMTTGAAASVLNALDLLPPGEYIRLSLKDPANTDRGALAYDYRAAGESEYTWAVELSTTYPSIDTRLSVTDLAQVPEGYSLTLRDTSSGEIFALDSDRTFPVTLNAATPKSFILTAVAVTKPTGVEDNKPLSFGIKGVSPNPFNPSTSITFGLEREGNVAVKIYTANGQLVDTLINNRQSAGVHTVTWNAKGHASGVYLTVVETGGKQDARKITLMK